MAYVRKVQRLLREQLITYKRHATVGVGVGGGVDVGRGVGVEDGVDG